MKAEAVGFKGLLTILIFVCSNALNSQIIRSGEIVFERRTNLEKRYEGVEMMGGRNSSWMKEPKIDEFSLYFNENASLFKPIPPKLEDEEREWATMKNTTYQDFENHTMKREFSFFGSAVFLSDSLKERAWIITENSREIAGYNTRQAFWTVDDSTRIYAWYAEQILPSVGPESFNGLPGAILGLAIEDGGVVYFAKEVKTLSKPNFSAEAPKLREKSTYHSEKELHEFLLKTFSNRPGMNSGGRMLHDFFVW